MLTQSPPARTMTPRLHCTPPYYQGRPAALWITVMNPHAMRPAVAVAVAARHPLPVPRPRPPQGGQAVPPAPRLSALYWTARPRPSVPPAR